MYDLNACTSVPGGWTLTTAYSISSLGLIAGVAFDGSGDIAAFMLIPAAGPTPTPVSRLVHGAVPPQRILESSPGTASDDVEAASPDFPRPGKRTREVRALLG